MPAPPADLPARVGELLRLAAAGDARLLPALDRLVDDLEHLLADGLRQRVRFSGWPALRRIPSIPKGCRKAVSSWRSRSITTATTSRERASRDRARPTVPRRCNPASSQPSTRAKF